MTVVVSSHLLSELEDYCSEMLMLEDGRVAGDGVVRLCDVYAADARARRVALDLADPVPDLAQTLVGLGLDVEWAGSSDAVVRIPGTPGAEAEALARLVGAGLRVRRFDPQPTTLEDVYTASRHDAPAAAP